MSKTEMLTKLRSLHEELAAINTDLRLSEQVDEETIDALGQLITDAGSIVDRFQGAPVATLESDPIGQELVDRVQKFESDHPLVGRFLTQVSDLLGNMGI